MVHARLLPFFIAILLIGQLSAQVTIADAGPDQYLCSTYAFLQGNAVSSGEVGTWTLVSGSAAFTDATDPGQQITALGPGILVLRWTITNGTNTTTDEVAIWIYDGAAPPANAGVDITVVLPQTSGQLLGSLYTFPTTCIWTIVSGTATIVDPTDPYSMTVGLSVGSNIFEWTCDNGPCGVTSDNVVITVEEAMALGWMPAMEGVRTLFDPHMERLSIIAPENIDRVILTDQMGRIVLDRSMNARSASLDVSHLSIGAFVVRAVMDDASFYEHFVVVR